MDEQCVPVPDFPRKYFQEHGQQKPHSQNKSFHANDDDVCYGGSEEKQGDGNAFHPPNNPLHKGEQPFRWNPCMPDSYEAPLKQQSQQQILQNPRLQRMMASWGTAAATPYYAAPAAAENPSRREPLCWMPEDQPQPDS